MFQQYKKEWDNTKEKITQIIIDETILEKIRCKTTEQVYNKAKEYFDSQKLSLVLPTLILIKKIFDIRLKYDAISEWKEELSKFN